jgi:hypothetical protein
MLDFYGASLIIIELKLSRINHVYFLKYYIYLPPIFNQKLFLKYIKNAMEQGLGSGHPESHNKRYGSEMKIA